MVARAQAYNEWEDAGLAFSEADLVEFHPLDVIDVRIARLIEHGQWFARRVQMELDKPGLTKDGLRFVKGTADWYGTIRGEMPAWDGSVPEPTSVEGKQLSAVILGQTLEDHVQVWRDEVEGSLRQYVSLSRRAAGAALVSGRAGMKADGEDFVPGAWTKADHSLSNKTANGLHRELLTATKLLAAIKVY